MQSQVDLLSLPVCSVRLSCASPSERRQFALFTGGSFDPLNLGTSGALGSPEEMQIKELKHCRLAMFAWLGIVVQAAATSEGPIAAWRAHVDAPFEANITSLLG